jgi:hypothetical protein
VTIVWWIQDHLTSVRSWGNGSEREDRDRRPRKQVAYCLLKQKKTLIQVAHNADVTGRSSNRVLIVTDWGKVSKPWQSVDTVNSKVQELPVGMDAPVLRVLQACAASKACQQRVKHVSSV